LAIIEQSDDAQYKFTFDTDIDIGSSVSHAWARAHAYTRVAYVKETGVLVTRVYVSNLY